MKASKALYFSLITLISLCYVSCLSMEPDVYCIFLKNNTEETLYVVYKWKCVSEKSFTKENKLSMDSILYDKGKLVSDGARDLWCFDEKPQGILESTDTLTIFILDKEEYEGKTWSQLVDSAHFRQIYHLSGDDIRLIGWKIPYPPSEAMRNMDMVPSYEEAVKQ